MNKKEYIEKYGEEKYAEHLLKRRSYNRTYREKYKEKVDAYNKQYFQEHKDELRIKNRKHSRKYYKNHRVAILQKVSEERFINHEKCLEKELGYRTKNKVRRNAQRKEWRKRDDVKEKEKTYGAIYREKNREEIRKKGREYHKDHSEYYKNCHKEYYNNHKDQIKKKNKEWQENNKDKVKIHDARKLAKRRKRGFEVITEPLNEDFDWHHISKTKPYVIAVPRKIHQSVPGNSPEDHYSTINGKWLIWGATHSEAKLKK